MRRLMMMAAGIVALGLPLAHGSDASSGFDGSFAKSEAACKADPLNAEMDDTLRVDEAGISGYELGCQFVGLQSLGDDRFAKEFVTIAACGDDSGITRPDSFWINVYEDGRLTLQSQNEYVAAEVFLSGDYVRCPE